MPDWSSSLERRVLELRRKYPHWGSRQYMTILHRNGVEADQATVTRILRHLTSSGQARPIKRSEQAEGTVRSTSNRSKGGLRSPVRWIDPGHSPLLLLPESLVASWAGSAGPALDPPRSGANAWAGTDYARACQAGSLGLVVVGDGVALVLGDDPVATTFVPQKAGGLIVRWIGAEDESSLIRVALTVPASSWRETVLHFESNGRPSMLFPAALAGPAARQDALTVKLPRGRYRIATALAHDEEAEVSVLVHSFVGASASRE